MIGIEGERKAKMFKVLLAEDEIRDLALLKGALDWEQHGMTIVGCAKDGQELEEMEEALRPDIVITDIVLPIFTGVEAARRIREKRPDVHIIFISGNVSFEYAVDGMEVGVERYILKPIDSTELTASLDELIEKCVKERQKKFKEEEFSREFETNLPVMREFFLRQCIVESGADEEELARQMVFYRIPIEPLSLYATMISPDEKLEEIYPKEYERMFYHLEIKKVIENTLEDRKYFLLHTDMLGNYILILNCRGENRQSVQQELASCLMKDIKQFCGISVSIGIGMPVDGFSRLPLSFESAKKALNQRFWLGREQIIFYCDVPYNSSFEHLSMETLLDKIINSAFYESDAVLNENIETFRRLVNECRMSAEDLCIHCITLISKTIVISNQPYLFSNITNVYKQLFRLDTAEAIFDFVLEFLRNTREQLMYNTRNHHTDVAKQVKCMIDEGLAEDLSLEIIAERIHFSKGYVAKIFKDVIGENLNRYIVKSRMRAAKKMLEETEMLIADIANAVGYSSAAYFSAAFKTEYSISPKTYRDQISLINRNGNDNK